MTNIDQPLLQLEGMIGFNGTVHNGLKVHPDKQHLIYPVGCTIVIEHLESSKQTFLTGHTSTITCVSVSKSGRFLGSGQSTHMGYKADVIVWDYDKKEMYCKLTLHMVKVEAMAFSPNELYLATLGGPDDGSVVVWNLEKKEAICGSPAQVMSAGVTKTIAYANHDENTFITGGETTLRVWKLDVQSRKIRPTEVNMGNIKRVVNCVEFEPDDSYFYCGTSTGDIMAINMNSKIFQGLGPKDKFSLGVTGLSMLSSGDLLVGAGDGTVAFCSGKPKDKGELTFKKARVSDKKLQGAVTSVALRGGGHQFFVGTNQSNIYKFTFADFKQELRTTCHYAPVNDVCFPSGSSDLYCTCSYQDIRLWLLSKNQELLRITIPNMTCNAVEIMRDGKSIISGWDDGRIRAFYPESGKPMYTIEDAHKLGVTALATTSDCQGIISGGKEGDVRVWYILNTYIPSTGQQAYKAQLAFSLKEHKAAITAIKVSSNDDECVTSSTDGSCIVWDLKAKCRIAMVRANTLFKYVCYHPGQYHILTSGTDRKVGYYEKIDGSHIRELEGSTGSINSLDVSTDGRYFVSGGDDKLVKVWLYDEGEATHVGIGHSDAILRMKISPDARWIISVSQDGAILRWRFPFSGVGQ